MAADLQRDHSPDRSLVYWNLCLLPVPSPRRTLEYGRAADRIPSGVDPVFRHLDRSWVPAGPGVSNTLLACG